MTAAFACSLTDAELVRGCAPEQPAEVKVGQQWMRCSDGETYLVKAIRGWCIDLGSANFTIVLDEAALRRDYVCTDPPDNVRRISDASA